MEKDDAQLLRDYLSSHDEASFAELIARHQQMVYGVCLRTLGNAADAKEVAQAVFLVMLGCQDKLLANGSYAGWLYVTAQRMAKDERRRIFRRGKREAVAMELMEQRSNTSNGQSTEIGDAVGAAVARLPEKYRAPLILHYIEGVPQTALAGQMGVSPSAVFSLLSRGRDMLRRNLARAGVMITAEELTASLSTEAATSVDLVPTLVRGAAELFGQSSATVSTALSPNTILIYREAMKTMFRTKLLTVSMVSVGSLVGAALVAVAVNMASNSGEVSSTTSATGAAQLERPAQAQTKMVVADASTDTENSGQTQKRPVDKVNQSSLNSRFDQSQKQQDEQEAKKASKVACINHLKDIALAIYQYAVDHGKALPPEGVEGLEILRAGNYLCDPTVYVCSDSKHPAKEGEAITAATCDYVYRPPVKKISDTKNPSEKPMAWHVHSRDSKGAPECVIVMFLDGHVETLKDPAADIERLGLDIQ